MVDVAGKILNVKVKTNRDDVEYQGVTFERADGSKFWFGNYSAESYKRGEQIRVTAKSTGEGNNITFLNGIQKVERERGARPAPPPAAPSPAPKPQPADPTGTGWDDDDEIPVRPAPPKPAPEGEADHSVTENAAPLGTLDDLADGVDPSRYGGVIVFRKGTTKAEVEFLLRAMAGVLAVSDVREYDEKGGSPVFYVP